MNTIIHESRTHRRKSEEIPIPSRQLCLYHPATHPPLLILCVAVLFFSAFFSVSQLHNPSILYHLTPEPDTRIPLPNISTLPYPPLPSPTLPYGIPRALAVPTSACLAPITRGSNPQGFSTSTALTHSLTDLFVRSVCRRERGSPTPIKWNGRGLEKAPAPPQPPERAESWSRKFQGSGCQAL